MKAIRHTGIVVNDLEQALRFYLDLLGLREVKRMEESGDYLDRITALKQAHVTTVKLAADDGNLIELLHFESNTLFSEKNIHCSAIGAYHVAFTVNDVDKTYAFFKKKGVKFNSAPQYSPDGHAKVAFCRDPDGNYIELVQEMNR